MDTGFNDYLTLPLAVISTLELVFAAPTTAALADGHVVNTTYHQASVRGDGRDRDVLVLATEGGAFVGTELLRGHEVHLEMIENGRVTVAALR